MINLNKETQNQKQIAVEFSSYDFAIKLNEYLKKGYTYINKIPTAEHYRSCIIIFQFPEK